MEAEFCITHVDNDTVSNQQPMKETAITYLTAQAELNRLTKDGLSTIPLIAWAVVVHKFTDTDTVSFGVHYISSSKATEEKTRRQSSICVVSIDPEARVRDFLLGNKHKLEPLGLESRPEVSTAILFHQGERDLEETLSVICHSRCKDHRYDVLIALSVNDENPTARLYYRSPAISESRAKRLRGNMAEAIQWLVKNPEQKMREAKVFSPEDYHQIAQWNNKSYFDQLDGQIIDAIIDQHALSNPTAAAIHSWDGNLTYAELKSLSLKLAAHLQSLGVCPGDMVPLCMEKSLWAIVAVLAVIRSGAAFVPLEALQPTKRLEGIIDRVNGRVILASPAHAASLERAERTVVRVSADAMAQLSPPEYTTPQRTASSTAYILFTSGSTGRPKGCIMKHSGLTGFAAHALPLQITRNSRVLQFASYSVHASLVETFCALSVGGTLCIPTDHDRMNDLQGSINRMGVTWTTMTPSTLKTLDTQNLRSMQTILTGAEAIPKNAYEIFEGGFWLLIGYGMTEWGGILSAQNPGTRDTMNIGEAFLGSIWLVDTDDHTQLVPVGAVGELLIEGPYLAHGYLDDEEKTAEAFVVDPVWLRQFRGDACPQRRLYKTGDLAKYEPDGTLRYVSRKDNQVKLRGYRIELEEVEYHLRQCWDGMEHDAVLLADVVVPAENSASPSLMAFILDQGEFTATDSSLFMTPDEQFHLRARKAVSKLREQLPGHMVPTVYIPLSYVPMTVSRKLDRRAIRTQAATLSKHQLLRYRTEPKTGENEKAQPSSIAELALHRMFALLLDLEPTEIGVNDSFYVLGGDSIGAMQLVSMCQAENIPLTVQDLFEKETIAGLADAVERNRLN
ncbi:acetyl-CoA synthetase-like protein [Penicillium concentricum]|uniref:Acetyl-CoA synthetase-like protein n=1 Tax=Penicillium concentricum TaxID=293559 RepID=A0A9W9S8H9_9EURO|nr:acetyl-CoA synthetase-like protein [Penicillium concentricum]KAJ5372589.1 acetyl-CoA synthetase-like protein [Penicillium concentricum]